MASSSRVFDSVGRWGGDEFVAVMSGWSDEDAAVDLAERLIRARMTPAAQDELVREFVRDLDRPSSGARTT